MELIIIVFLVAAFTGFATGEKSGCVPIAVLVIGLIAGLYYAITEHPQIVGIVVLVIIAVVVVGLGIAAIADSRKEQIRKAEEERREKIEHKEPIKKGRKTFIIATKNYKYGLLDSEEKILVPFEYDNLEPFNIGREKFLKARKETRFGLISLNEKFPHRFRTLYPILKIGNKMFYEIRVGAKCGIIDLKGEILLPFEYDSISLWGNIEEIKFLIARKGKKFGVIRIIKSARIIVPFEYDELKSICHKRLRLMARKGERWGVINWYGRVILPIQYDKLTEFKDKHIVAEKGNKTRIIPWEELMAS